MDFSTIDPTVGASMVSLASALSNLVLKGTATAIHGKIESVKNEKDINTVRNTYNEIVNQLLEEREDAVRIAQTYKQELEKVIISDEDIEYLHQTIAKALTVLVALQIVDNPNNADESSDNSQAVQMITSLISKDVLKTMQLLGFNFKAAIGEPLTQLCANAINSLSSKKQQTNQKNKSKIIRFRAFQFPPDLLYYPHQRQKRTAIRATAQSTSTRRGIWESIAGRAGSY